MVLEAEIKQMEMGTPSSVTCPNQSSSGSSHYMSSQKVSPLSTQEPILFPQSSKNNVIHVGANNTYCDF
jgi:hypothetical protein